MEYPQGMANVSKDNCIIVNKWIHCFIQAARHYYKMAIKMLKKVGFVRGDVDHVYM